MFKSTLLYITFVILLCMESAPALSQNAYLEGTVIDEETGDTLIGANIVISKVGALLTWGTASNHEGHFELAGIGPGEHTIIVSHIGYESAVLENELFEQDETKFLQVALTPGVIESEQIVVTASLKQEKMLEAPASVSVIERVQLQIREPMTPIDHLQGITGVDIVKTGLNQSNVVVRGLNNVFSGALLTLVDNRITRVPSIRLNAHNFIPTTNADLERIEIIRGPGSALYGPNSANGILHMITRSPFGSEGTTLSVSGGERNILITSFRHAGSYENKIGYKISGSYTQGEDFKYVDPEEIVPRDFDIEKLGVDARLDFRPSNDLTFIFNGGINRATNIELTGAGAGQAKNWHTVTFKAGCCISVSSCRHM